MVPILQTSLGHAYQADCVDFLRTVEDVTVDLAFADPPFNLGKSYSSGINDRITDEDYLNWCKGWLDGMVRTLKPGGSLFLWNLPQ